MAKAMHNINDVQMYLDGTLCMYKGLPVYVDVGHGDGKKIMVRYVGTDKNELIDYTSDYFDYRSLELGYLQYNASAYYFERSPARKTKQGIAYENSMGTSPAGGRIGVHDVAMTTAMRDCILGKHMTEDEALRGLLGGMYKSAAVSRNIALQVEEGSKISLWHKNHKVGEKNYNDQFFTLINGNHASFMKRFLEKKVCIQ